MTTDAGDDGQPSIMRLSVRQLEAYNRAELEAFCACYHPDIEVLGADGQRVHRGGAAFRAAYGAMFEAHDEVRGVVDGRVVLGEHVVEREHWSRVVRATGERRQGSVLVRYSEQDGLIRVAQFFAPRG